jgi:preprotein translocase subunit SecA
MVTVNDYLARRDCEWNGPLFNFLGLTVDCLEYHSPNSSFSMQSIYSTNPKTQEIYFVILNASRPMLIDKKPKEIYKTNCFMEKTELVTSDFSYSNGELSFLDRDQILKEIGDLEVLDVSQNIKKIYKINQIILDI